MTLAGAGNGDRGPAANALLREPAGLRLDAAGNLYVAERAGHRIRRIDATTGVITTVAGLGSAGYGGDGGPAARAQINAPTDLAFDAAGNLFFTDTENFRIRRIDAGTGVITTVVGKGTCGSGGDGGPAAAAETCRPQGLSINPSGEILFSEGNSVRKVSNGVISTVAGGHSTGHCGLHAGDPALGLGISDRFNGPSSVAWDGAGGYYVADTNNRWICRVDAAGIISVTAGLGPFFGAPQPPAPAEGPVATTPIGAPSGLALDSGGNLFFAEGFGHRVMRLQSGVVTKVAGSGTPQEIAPGVFGPIPGGFSGDGGPATAARLNRPDRIALDAAGNVFIADSQNGRIRKVSGDGAIQTIAGRTPLVGDGGPALSADLSRPAAALRMPAGELYIADTLNHRVRRVDGSGVMTTAAGTGVQGVFATNTPGPGTSIALNGPLALARDSSNRLLIADTGAHRVRMLDTAGTLSTIAGTGSCCLELGQTGPALSAQLYAPGVLATDSAGNLFIGGLDFLSGIRKVDGSGLLTTLAGISPSSGGFAVDASGNLFFSVPSMHRIRRRATDGTVTDFAGTGSAGFAGDGGTAVEATFNTPRGLAFDADGNLYVADYANHRIRAITPAGLVQTIAGNGVPAFGGDGGPALAASLLNPSGISVDAANNLIIADEGNDRIRSVALADVTPAPFSFPSQSGVAVSTQVQSASVVLTDFGAVVPVSITGGEYSIGCNGTFTSAPGTATPGATICVRHLSAARFNDDALTTIRVGNQASTFSTTTATGPGQVAIAPAPLGFGTQSMNTTSLPRVVTLTNTSSATVTVNEVRIDGAFAVAAHDCATLAPSASCAVSVTFTPRAEGALVGTLTLRNSPGTQTVALAGSGEKSLVSHYYQSILGRTPEAGGRSFWEGEITRMAALTASPNEVWFAMAMQFFTSPEYVASNRDNDGFLADLYRTFFNRAADSSGLSYWRQQLSLGMPREAVLVWFMFSPEFASFTTAISGNTAARAEVDMVMDFYRGLLGRLPDTAGFNNWIGRFRTAQCSGAAVVRAQVEAISSEFILGAEYLGRNRTNGQFVGDLYNAFLRRGGDPSSVRAWITTLNTRQYTRDVVRGGFILSSEFQQRVNRVIQQGCMP